MENDLVEGEGPPEKDPNYKKKVQWFGLAAIGLLCFTLIISVFTGTGKRKGDAPQPLPVDQAVQIKDESQRRLNEQIEQERLRLRREQEQKSIQVVEPEKRIANIMAGKAASQHQLEKAGQGGSQLSIEQEFAQQERRRALAARLSRFGLRKTSDPAGPALAPAAVAPQPTTAGNDKLIEEQQRVAKEIQRLQQIQQGAAPPPPAAQTMEDSLTHVSQADPASAITIGQPASEAKPKPGQRLIPTGTIISAVLDQKLMSDYSGPFRALVSKDVYDVSGNYIVVPKGCRVTGSSVRISNINEPIQARMGLTVRWFVLPDGNRISLEKRVAALDKEGVPAIKDKVNYHFFAQFLGVAAYAVLASESSYEGSSAVQEQSFEGDVGEALREQFAPLAEKYLNLVPTITLNIGTPINIFLEDDIYATPWDSVHKKLYRASN